MVKSKICTIFLLLGLICFSPSCQQKSNLILVQAGMSAYTIVLSESASSSEKYAAQELQQTIEFFKIGEISSQTSNSQKSDDENEMYVETGVST